MIPESPSLPLRPSLVDEVVQSLTRFIRAKGMRAGDRLPTEAELAKSMAVSRNALREAVGRLVSLGLVEVRRGSGMFVGGADTIRSCALLLRASLAISTGDLVEFTEFRRVLEGHAARNAALKATDEELAELKALALAIDKPGIPREESLLRDEAFHLRLMAVGGNRLMTALLESLLEFLRASMDSTAASPRDSTTSQRLHAAIVDALCRRDSNAAEQAMELNQQHTLQRLLGEPSTGETIDVPHSS